MHCCHAEQAAEALADDPSTRTPQAQAVELMCRCEDVSDEGVELHVLKGLLTATTAATFTIHGEVSCSQSPLQPRCLCSPCST